MNNDLRTRIYNNLSIKDTEDLLEIWQNDDTAEWSEEAFEIIRELLTERLGYVPPQPLENQLPQILRNVEEHLEKEELDLALQECERALQIDPGSAMAHNYLGEIHDQKGRLEIAIVHYQRAVQFDDEFKDAWENLLSLEAELETEFGQSRAKQHLDQALEYSYDNEPEKALQECEIAKTTLPGIAIAHNYLGMILETLSQLEPAIASYLKAIQFNPRFYAARQNLANARVRLEEERYLRGANVVPSEEVQGAGGEANRKFDDGPDLHLIEDGKSVPGWWYLDADAFLLRGWPGYRTRPGRSGYDPLDRDFELAHVVGVVTQRLLTRRFKTRNPVYLLMMVFLGLYLSMPLLFVVTLLQGDLYTFPLIIIYTPHVIVGVALLINVFLSIRLATSGEYEDKGSTFF